MRGGRHSRGDGGIGVCVWGVWGERCRVRGQGKGGGEEVRVNRLLGSFGRSGERAGRTDRVNGSYSCDEVTKGLVCVEERSVEGRDDTVVGMWCSV